MANSAATKLAKAFAKLALPILFALPASAQSLDALYENAKAEGALSLYAGGPTVPWEAAAKEFSARFPGIAVSVTGGFSNLLDKKIDAQLAAGKLEADLAMFQTLQDFVRWKQQGALLEFKPQGFDKIDPSFADPDGAFVAVLINAHIYAYNPNLVNAEDVPRSALDFLNSRFRGKVVTCYPADDDATLYAFYSIVQKYGWSYMDRFCCAKQWIARYLHTSSEEPRREHVIPWSTTHCSAGSRFSVVRLGQGPGSLPEGN